MTWKREWTIVILSLLFCAPLLAGVHYSDARLFEEGSRWKRVDLEWNAEKKRIKRKLNEIKTMDVSESQKALLIQNEYEFYKGRSKELAIVRTEVQDVMITETNARARGGRTQTSDGINATLGTKPGEPGYQGMKSDLDVQGGALTAETLKATIADMGLEGDLIIRNNAGTLEIGGNFDLCIHKTGVRPIVGSELHNMITNVDARNPEVYLSERMDNDKITGQKQVGRDYVEVQDHLKKARAGHATDPIVLSKHKPRMQKMAKGTGKTLDIGALSDDEVAAILKQNKIDATPAEFRTKLEAIKTGNYEVDSPSEAGKIRDASKDIFDAAEQVTAGKAKSERAIKEQTIKQIDENIKKVNEMSDKPETQARQQELKESLEARKKAIQEELFDSKTKMDASKASNNEFQQENPRQKTDTDAPDKPKPAPDAGKQPDPAPDTSKQPKPAPDTGEAPKPKRLEIPTPGGPEVKVPDTPTGGALDNIKTKVVERYGKGGMKQVKADGGKILEVTGVITDIADIGNACKKLENYIEGKATLGEVIEAAVVIHPVVGAANTVKETSKKAATSAWDYYQTHKTLQKANQTNMEGYLSAWELQFVKAGMSRTDARRYVANAMLGDNLDFLEARAEFLRAQGTAFETPKLIVDESSGPDGGSTYMLTNAKDTFLGMAGGIRDGVVYIVGFPANLFVAGTAEKDLSDATLITAGTILKADMKKRLFRAFLNAGISSKEALLAVNGSERELHRIAAKARENLKAMKEDQAKKEAAALVYQQQLNQCIGYVRDLRFVAMTVDTDADGPLVVAGTPKKDACFPVKVSLGGDLSHHLNMVTMGISQLTGMKPAISLEYACSVKSAKAITKSSWQVEVPAEVGIYPIAISLRVTISGLTGDCEPMNRIFTRTVEGTIAVKASDATIRFDKPNYTFEAGFMEELGVVVTTQTPDAEFFYHWTIDGKSHTSYSPTMQYNPEAANKECPKTVAANVSLCDLATGCVLAEAAATIVIEEPQYQQFAYYSPMYGNQLLYAVSLVKCDYTTVNKANDYAIKNPMKQKDYSKEILVRATCPLNDTPPGRPTKLYLGCPHGPFIKYCDGKDDVVEQIGNYRNGLRHGLWEFYGFDSTTQKNCLQYTITYVNGIKNGIYKSYSSHGLHGITHYKNNIKHGPYVAYGNFGKILNTGTYKEGLEEGEWVTYYLAQTPGDPSGISTRIVYSNQKKTRQVTRYREDGSLQDITHWEGDKKHGKESLYDNQNRLYRMHHYDQGIYDGPYAEYEKGLLKEEGAYRQGKFQGEIRSYSIIKGKSTLSSQGSFDQGLPVGVHQSFRGDGTLWTETPFVNGLRHGMVKSYSADNKLADTTPYINGKQHGTQTDYWDGKLNRTTQWVDGKKHGVENSYDENGKVSKTYTWVNGERQ